MTPEEFIAKAALETVKDVYKDGLSGAVSETGKILTDSVKVLRLLTAPIQILASYQDRLTNYCARIAQEVPDEKRISVPASLSGPILDRLKYLDDENYLTNLYLNLLSRAMNKDRVNEAHPAFLHIIDQLSPDEAMFLSLLKEKPIKRTAKRQFVSGYQKEPDVIVTDLPEDLFTFPENLKIYQSHLESLNLVEPQKDWKESDSVHGPDYPFVQLEIPLVNEIDHTEINATEFGKLFIKACLPSP